MSEGRKPEAAELKILTRAKSAACEMTRAVERALRDVSRLLLPGSDPRLFPEAVSRTARLFEAHFKSRSPGEARELADGYEAVRKALEALTAASYRVVSDDVVEREEGGDTYAYVRGREPIIYLAQHKVFGELSTRVTAERRSSRSTVAVGDLILNDDQRARLLIHEVAHFRLGVKHRGGVFTFANERCESGHPVRGYSEAASNAYCYDHFAHCASRSP